MRKLPEIAYSESFEKLYKLYQRLIDNRPLEYSLGRSDLEIFSGLQAGGFPLNIPELGEKGFKTLDTVLQTLDKLGLCHHEPTRKPDDLLIKYQNKEQQLDREIEEGLHANDERYFAYAVSARGKIEDALYSVRNARDYLDILTHGYAAADHGCGWVHDEAKKHVQINPHPDLPAEEKMLAQIHGVICQNLREAESATIEKLAHEKIGLATEEEIRKDFTTAIEQINTAFGIKPESPNLLSAPGGRETEMIGRTGHGESQAR